MLAARYTSIPIPITSAMEHQCCPLHITTLSRNIKLLNTGGLIGYNGFRISIISSSLLVVVCNANGIVIMMEHIGRIVEKFL
jgi:hypothetical protein